MKNIFQRLFIRVIGLFLILYIPMYVITFSAYFLGVNDYNKLNINYDSYLLLLNILTWFPFVIFTVFTLMYISIRNNKIAFVIRKGGEVKKVIISFVLAYFILSIMDPFYHNFNLEDAPIFKFNSISFEDIFLDLLLVLIIAPIFEELFFRDLLLVPFLKKNQMLLGAFVTSMLYSVSHFYVTNDNYDLDYLSLMNYFLIGIIFSILRIKYGILFAFLAHFFYNSLLLLDNLGVVDLHLFHYIVNHQVYWLTYIICVSLVLFICVKLLSSVKFDARNLSTKK
ncbi:MAG: CPBP family intramembrane metalloprotease [Lewinellaceae bacterium]|nr:CPBP family intramembrane metalloprotease [Lewinellaceae bacterium]